MALLIVGGFLPALTGTTNAAAGDITVTVCLTDSGGSRIVPGTTYDKIGSTAYFDSANNLDGNNCKYQVFPAGTTNVEIWTTYNHTTSAHITQDISTNPNFDFHTNLLTLQLATCAATGLAGGHARFGSGAIYTTAWFPDISTATNASGDVAAQVFPGTYSFDMQYHATSQQKLSVVVPDVNTSLLWQTTNVTIVYPGSVSYGGATGDSTWFKQTSASASMELLPGTYKFHFRDLADGTLGFTEDLTFSGCSFTYGETANVPLNVDDCKKGGWKTLVDSSGNSFKNQGDCVSFVATGGKNLAAGGNPN